MPQLIKQFLNFGMPILEHNLKYQTDDITGILKMMQGRKIHEICFTNCNFYFNNIFSGEYGINFI